MRKTSTYLFLLAFGATHGAFAAEPLEAPVSTTKVTVNFPHKSTTFVPDPESAAALADAWDASLVTISGRTSNTIPTASDEAVALARAVSARSYLIARGVSPLK